MEHLNLSTDDVIVDVRVPKAPSSLVIVCEHASRHIPLHFNNLGLPDDQLNSHVVWDPGALALAHGMADRLGATLIYAKTSRLVYDCNRPPDAPDAMPVRSEVVDVPGNCNLSDATKAERIDKYYEPFRSALAQTIARTGDPILITVHSFTPTFHGKQREVEIGVLHDSDTRLADALLSSAEERHVIRRNEPYGPADGVTHTLKEHALPRGHLNVMLEVRNDLIADPASQAAMADTLSDWLSRALKDIEADAC